MANPVVDIYCRTATDDPETRTKLEQQEAACRAYCQRQALPIGLTHAEVASVSTYREREQLTRLRRRIRDGHIQGVVVTSLDRLSRSHVHLAILLGEMEAYGVTLHCVSEQPDIMSKLVRTIYEFVIEVEREKAVDSLLTDPER